MANGFIKQIQIDGLFNRLDYQIDFKNNYPVSILIGPNGTGKSTILNCLQFMLAPSYQSFRAIEYVDFNQITLTLEHGYEIILKRTQKDVSRFMDSLDCDDYLKAHAIKKMMQITGLSFAIQRTKEDIKNSMSSTNASALELLQTVKYFTKSIEDEIEGFTSEDRIIQQQLEGFIEFEGVSYLDYWYKENEEISFNKLFESIAQQYPDSSVVEKFYAARALFVYMVEYAIYKSSAISERLQIIRANRSDDLVIYNFYNELSFYLRTSVYLAQSSLEGLKKNWQSLVEKTIDTTAPKSYQEYREALDNYYQLKKYNVELGLLEPFDDFLDLNIDEITFNDNKRKYGNYLNYAKDALPLTNWNLKRFIDVFNQRNDVSEVELFIKKVKDNYCLKQMAKKVGKKADNNYYGDIDHFMLLARNTYDKENEFFISNLSTGQKHDLVMFYQLLFKTNKGETVLIDEPEISQHIDVQEQFVDEILDVCLDKDIQCLIATHSPYIVSDHINMVVDKKVVKHGE